VVNHTGSFKIVGASAISPLEANVRVSTSQLDVAAMSPYLSNRLNVTIPTAALTTNATVNAKRAGDRLLVRYQGDAMVGHLRMLDRATSDLFVRWNSLEATHIDATYGEARAAVSVGAVKLADFYARVILNSDKSLNLSDIMRSSRSTPTSLTRERPGTAAELAPPTSIAPNLTIVDVAIGGITAQNGHINWTDDFIQPHYTADLTDIRGAIGAFGTRSTAPSDVSFAGKINRTSPVEISGRINPLITNPYVNIDAKAQDVELTALTPIPLNIPAIRSPRAH
jgi:hypothetical protein